MKTINANSTGYQFIQDLNDNFAECISGCGDGNVSVNAPLQGGDLKSSTGYVDGRWCTGSAAPYTWTDDDFYKYLHTPCYLSLKGNKVNDVNVPSGSALTIFCYDEEFEKTAAVSDEANIPNGTAYVKFQLYNSSGYSAVLALSLTLAAQPEWIKNTAEAYTAQFFNYDCKPPKLWDTNYTVVHSLPTGATPDNDTTRYHDNGVVILPPNYSPTGKPCKLVIWFQGDGTPVFIRHDPFTGADGNQWAYDDNFKYFNAQGYAVAMCTGYTSMWKNEQGSTDPSLWVSRLTPAYIASLRAFYDRLMENYNFEPAVYLGAKSAGGGMLMHTASMLPFPVRAAAGMSVGLCQFDGMRYSYLGTQKTMQKKLGCSNWNDFVLSPSGSGKTATLVHTGSGANANQLADAARLSANTSIYQKTDPFTLGSDIDYDAFATQVLALTNPFNDGADYPSALTNVIYAAHKVMLTPLKLWCATKDDATPYTWHKIMVEWLRKCGCIAELRSYTGSDGGHGTFSGPGNKTATSPTRYGGNRTAGIGIIEAVNWFNQW